MREGAGFSRFGPKYIFGIPVLGACRALNLVGYLLLHLVRDVAFRKLVAPTC